MKKKTALISFVGTNDRGDIPNKGEGAVLAVFEERKYNFVYLLWHNSKEQNTDFKNIAEIVRQKLEDRKLCQAVNITKFECESIVDHNSIYPKLLEYCKQLPTDYEYTAAISSGTPSLQACWLLLAESEEFKLELIRTNEKIYAGDRVVPVKLGWALPKIKSLRKEIQEILPELTINLSTGIVKVGEELINLSPVEFSHYCVLAQGAKQKAGQYNFKEEEIPQEMVDEARSYYDNAFPQKIELLLKSEIEARKHQGVLLKTWRSYVSTINKAFENSNLDPAILKYFIISKEGKRYSSLYSIKTPPKNIRFTSK